MKNLVIVESPAKAKTIKKYLGRNYEVVASMGHVIDLPKSQLGVDIENDFEPKYITIRGKGEMVSKLKKLASKSTKVLLATDPDREGEAISWHLSRALGVDASTPCRIEFNEVTEAAVKKAVKNPRSIDFNLVDSQQARRVLDRLVGYKISPILWEKVKKGLSAGRVQSVALRIICERENSINEFIPSEYWSVTAYHIKDKIDFISKLLSFKGEKLEIKDKASTESILSDLGKEFKVSKVKESDKNRNSPPPFITSSLQQEASKKLNFPTKKTMQIAQQLYEGIDIKEQGSVGLITYMRTDSVRISDYAYEGLQDFIKAEYGEIYVNSSRHVDKKNKKVQDAHECIRPTNIDLSPNRIKESLSRDQYRLYRLIFERFVASGMSSAKFKTVSADLENNGYTFRANGSTLVFKGYLLAYDDYEDKDSRLPVLAKGEILASTKIEPKQHFTQPPSRYTEASLVKELEDLGIGRPSTYSPTISTIIARNYVYKDKKNLVPTEIGNVVNDLVTKSFNQIVDYEFTASLEKKLDQIEDGDLQWKRMLSDFYLSFEKDLAVASTLIEKIQIKDEESDQDCELCGRKLVYKMGRYGKFLACPGFPDCKNTKAIVETIGVSCPECKAGETVIKRSKKGRIFYGCSKYPSCEYVSWDKPSNYKCPKCGSLTIEKSSKKGIFYLCSGEKCDYSMQKEVENES